MNRIIERLCDLLPADTVYPKGVVAPIRPKIRGRSFFPGGCGSSVGATQEIPNRPIMLVGQDFGNLGYWDSIDAVVCADGEGYVSTWAGIRKLDRSGMVNLKRCFFTNVLLGVRNAAAIKGPSPGLAFPEYVNASVNHLLSQIRILQPSVVVAMGVVPGAILGLRLGLTSAVRFPCEKESRNDGWKEIDAAGLQFQEVPSLDGCIPFAFATVVHPVYLSNSRYRTWSARGLKHSLAEDEIWKCIRNADSSSVGPSSDKTARAHC